MTIVVFFSGPHLPEFLLPFRKPKRIRTAFSPSQLLKLEQAFEKNQYVVGAERKELAKNLNLSETQVRAFPTKSWYFEILIRGNLFPKRANPLAAVLDEIS